AALVDPFAQLLHQTREELERRSVGRGIGQEGFGVQPRGRWQRGANVADAEGAELGVSEEDGVEVRVVEVRVERPLLPDEVLMDLRHTPRGLPLPEGRNRIVGRYARLPAENVDGELPLGEVLAMRLLAAL